MQVFIDRFHLKCPYVWEWMVYEAVCHPIKCMLCSIAILYVFKYKYVLPSVRRPCVLTHPHFQIQQTDRRTLSAAITYCDVYINWIIFEVHHDWQHGHGCQTNTPGKEEEQDQAGNEETHSHRDAHIQLPVKQHDMMQLPLDYCCPTIKPVYMKFFF